SVCMAIDESRDRAEPAAVDLDDVALERLEVAHPPDGCDLVAIAHDVCVFDDLDRAELGATERCVPARRRRDLREPANEQRHAASGACGTCRPPRSAASTAS